MTGTTAKFIAAAVPPKWHLVAMSAVTLSRSAPNAFNPYASVRVPAWEVTIERGLDRITVRSPNPVPALIEAAKVIDLLAGIAA